MQSLKRMFSVAGVAILVSSALAQAQVAQKTYEAPELSQESQHKKAIQRIENRFSRYHYENFQLNDQLSEKIWNRYLEVVDYNKSLFLL